MVKLLSAYDVWDHDRFEWSDTMSFQYGMRGYCGLDVDMAAKVSDYRMVVGATGDQFSCPIMRGGSLPPTSTMVRMFL